MVEHRIPFESIVAQSNDVVVVTKAEPLSEPGPEIVYVNEAFSRLTGYSREEAIGRSPRFLQGAGTDPESMRAIREALAEGRPVRQTVRNYGKSGEAYWIDLNIVPLIDESGRTIHFAAVQRDVTKDVERERMLEESVRTDALTGVYNRRAFLEYAAHEVARAKRYGEPLTLAALDLDHFKMINDRFGHAAGDAVLKRFGELCSTMLRQTDIVARIGGEEFAVLMPHTPLDAARVAMDRVRRTFSQSEVQWNGTSIPSSVSVGLAAFLQADESIDPVLQRADFALYQAKSAGRNCVVKAPLALASA